MDKKYLLLIIFVNILLFAGFVQAATNNETERLLPTVNKVNPEKSSERVLPMVNKRTIEARINVVGWDEEKQKEIEDDIKKETDNNLEINSAQIMEDNVNLNYLAPAKFLGFIPMSMGLNISSDSKGLVKVEFPWYKFLVKTDFSNIAELINGVLQNNQTNLEFLKSQDSKSRQIGIFMAISNILKAKHDTVKNSINNIK